MATLKALNEKAVSMGLIEVRKSHVGYEIISPKTITRDSGVVSFTPLFWAKTLKQAEFQLNHLIAKKDGEWFGLISFMASDEKKSEAGMTCVNGVWVY